MIRSSLSRLRSSRSDGARSRGPKAVADEQRSSRIALRQDLLPKQALLHNETSAEFDLVVAEHIQKLRPADGVELGLVEEMAVASWRLRRARASETSLMDQGLAAGRPHAAFAALAASHQLALLHRQKASLHRMYQSAMRSFLLLHKTKLPSSPSGHSGTPDLPPPESSPEVAPVKKR